MNTLGAREFYLFVRQGRADARAGRDHRAGAAADAADRLRRSTRAAPRNTVAQQLDAEHTLFGVNQTGEPQLVEPKGVALGPDGTVYVSEARAQPGHRLQPGRHDRDRLGTGGTGDGEFNEPWGIAVAPSGEVFVADTWNHRIQKFAPDGRFVTAWGGLVDANRDPCTAHRASSGDRARSRLAGTGCSTSRTPATSVSRCSTRTGTFVRTFGGGGDRARPVERAGRPGDRRRHAGGGGRLERPHPAARPDRRADRLDPDPGLGEPRHREQAVHRGWPGWHAST